MPLVNIDNVERGRVSPPPIHDSIIENSRPTVIFIRYLQDLRKNNGDIYAELNKVIDQVNLNIDEINSLQIEVDKIEVGAGLNTDGTYIAPNGTTYIDSTTSLANADIALDGAVVLTDSRQKIINTAVNYQALNENQLIIADATSGTININLPDPAAFLFDGYSKTIGITKKDISANKVVILPFASELIVGEISQYLEIESEVLNFISDGTNWLLNN